MMTNRAARIGDDNLIHILDEGRSCEWKACCASTWFHESTVEQLGTTPPTCLACIVEDARWWQAMRGIAKNAFVDTLPHARRRRFQ